LATDQEYENKSFILRIPVFDVDESELGFSEVRTRG
jgi:hypothetical protein